MKSIQRKHFYDGDSVCDDGFITPLLFGEWNWCCTYEEKRPERNANTYICPKQSQSEHQTFSSTECLVNSL